MGIRARVNRQRERGNSARPGSTTICYSEFEECSRAPHSTCKKSCAAIAPGGGNSREKTASHSCRRRSHLFQCCALRRQLSFTPGHASGGVLPPECPPHHLARFLHPTRPPPLPAA